jgi:hypothetical protein
MLPSDRRRWLALAPPEPPPPPKRPPPPGNWRAGWRAIADDLMAAEEPAEAPSAGPPRPLPVMPRRRHRADVARRYGLDPVTLAIVESELEARERERRRQVLAGDDQGVDIELGV